MVVGLSIAGLITLSLGVFALYKFIKRHKNVIVIVNEGDAAKIEAAYQDFVNRKIGQGEYANRMYSEKDAFKMAARKLLSE